MISEVDYLALPSSNYLLLVFKSHVGDYILQCSLQFNVRARVVSLIIDKQLVYRPGLHVAHRYHRRLLRQYD